MLARVQSEHGPSAILTVELLGGALASAGLLGVLAEGFGLGPFGIVVGAAAAAALLAALVGAGVPALGPAGRVTLARGVLVVGVTALVADPVSTPALVVLAGVALLLDGVDGQVARRRNLTSEFGATEGQGLWKLFQDFVANPDDIDGIAQQMERAASQAFG